MTWTVPEGVDPGINYRIRIHKTGDETIEDYSDFFSIINLRYINVTNPQPNAEWQRGTSQNITWTSNVPNGFKIELLDYRYSPPTTTLIHNFNYSGYSWSIPAGTLPGSMYKIRVTSIQYPDVTGQSEFFTITLPPSITVTSPVSSTSWPTATNQTITWTDNVSGDVHILLYKQSASPSFITTIASATPSDGSFDWFIPQTLTPGTDYYIIIRASDNASINDASDLFTISQGNYILVTTPSTGTQWEAGVSYKIYWNDNVAENVMIILRKPSLSIQDTISASTPSDGEYKWFVPVNSVPATNYNIFIRSVSNANVYDYSDPFEITNASGSFITVTSPTADSVWKMGTQRTITWDDNIAEDVSIRLYKGGSFNTLLWGSKSGNSHTFMVPTSLTPGTDYQIKVTSTVNSAIYDFSPNFQIIPADFIDFTGPAAFRMNDSVPILWNDNINDHVKIELLLADTLYSVITLSTGSDGSYVWGVPGNLPVEQWYKIRITSLGNPSLSDVSNASHIYFPFYINVTDPEAGYVMLKDSSYAIQWDHNFINGEHYNIDLCKGGDSIRRIKTGGSAGYYMWPINCLYEDLVSGTDYSLKVTCVEHPEVYDFSEVFTILDCDSVLFLAGNDTVLYRNSEIDLIATDGFDSYMWTPMQGMNRVCHIMGGVYNAPDTVQVVCLASFTGGCIKRDTLMLTIADPPCYANAAFTKTYYVGDNICNTWSFFNLGDSTLGYRIQYDFGDVTMIDTTSVMVTHTFPGPGTYIVTCTVYDPVYAGCQDVYVDSVVIQPPPAISFLYSISVDTGLFVPTMTGPGVYRVEWWIDTIPADNLLADTHYTDSLRVIFPENGTYQVCAAVYDTVHPGCYYTYCEEVTITDIPPCRNTTCYFAARPLYGYGSGTRNKFRIMSGVNDKLSCYTLSWNMGDGSPVFYDSLNFDYTYAPGTYIVNMTVTDCGLCSHTHTDTITAYPPLDPGLPNTAQGCDSLELVAVPGYFYYVWQDSTVSSTLPVYSSGSYWIMVQDGFGYYKRDTSAVSIAPTLDVSMNEIPVLCSDGISYILEEGNPNGGLYQGSYISGTTFDIAAAGPGFYPVKYYFQNNLGCSDTAYGVIEVEPEFTGNRVLQNQYITGQNYFTGDTIFTGSSVTDTIPQGLCVFVYGSNTILKAQNNIRLLPGTRVMQNCYFKAHIGPLSCLSEKSVQDDRPGDLPQEENTPQNIFIGPNPAGESAVLFIRDGYLDGYRMRIYNGMGLPVGKESMLSGKQVYLDLSGLQPGIYFITVWNDEENQSLKLIRK
jgi:hypothetical protein